MVDADDVGDECGVDDDPVGDACGEEVEGAGVGMSLGGFGEDDDGEDVANITEDEQRG